MYHLAFRSSHQRSQPPRPRAAAWCAAQCTAAAGRSARTCAARVPLVGVRAIDDRSTIARPSGSARPRAAREQLENRSPEYVPSMHRSTYRSSTWFLRQSVCCPRTARPRSVGAVDVPLDVLLVSLPLSSATSTAIRHYLDFSTLRDPSRELLLKWSILTFSKRIYHPT